MIFLSSAALLVLEMVAGRLLAPYIGVSLYSLTSIIIVILAGLSLGNGIGGAWPTGVVTSAARAACWWLPASTAWAALRCFRGWLAMQPASNADVTKTKTAVYLVMRYLGCTRQPSGSGAGPPDVCAGCRYNRSHLP